MFDVKRVSVETAQRLLSKKRYIHSMNVANVAGKLAEQYGVDPDRAWLAGVLHDICREFSSDALLLKAREACIIMTDTEKRHPILLHGKVAAGIARDQLGVIDSGILLAISSHVTGRKAWNRLEQLVYLADKIEPGRDYPGVDAIRQLAESGNLYCALAQSLGNTIDYVDNDILHSETAVAFDEISRNSRHQ